MFFRIFCLSKNTEKYHDFHKKYQPAQLFSTQIE